MEEATGKEVFYNKMGVFLRGCRGLEARRRPGGEAHQEVEQDKRGIRPEGEQENAAWER